MGVDFRHSLVTITPLPALVNNCSADAVTTIARMFGAISLILAGKSRFRLYSCHYTLKTYFPLANRFNFHCSAVKVTVLAPPRCLRLLPNLLHQQTVLLESLCCRKPNVWFLRVLIFPIPCISNKLSSPAFGVD